MLCADISQLLGDASPYHPNHAEFDRECYSAMARIIVLSNVIASGVRNLGRGDIPVGWTSELREGLKLSIKQSWVEKDPDKKAETMTRLVSYATTASSRDLRSR